MYENLKAELAIRNLTYEQGAAIIRVIPATFTKRLQGIADWRLQELWRLADYLNCSIDYLIGRTDENNIPSGKQETDATNFNQMKTMVNELEDSINEE